MVAAQRWFKAMDTFVADLKDGSSTLVAKGDTKPESHELVKRDLAAGRDNPGRIPLFAPLDLGDEDEAPAKSGPEAEAPPEPVKAAGGRTAGKSRG